MTKLKLENSIKIKGNKIFYGLIPSGLFKENGNLTYFITVDNSKIADSLIKEVIQIFCEQGTPDKFKLVVEKQEEVCICNFRKTVIVQFRKGESL